MSRTATVRRYGKAARKPRVDLFAELPKSSPIKSVAIAGVEDPVDLITEQLTNVRLESVEVEQQEHSIVLVAPDVTAKPEETKQQEQQPDDQLDVEDEDEADETLRLLTWSDLCPPGDKIQKIAEASFAEVYRVSNERGTSILKVIRLDSPIKPKTKQQEKSGLVDEEPHTENDLQGELLISEWLADIPGFVVYKERYFVKGKTTKGLLETHQTFHRKLKRQDPDRLQFYPSPSRYLDGTKFLVVELGDAGKALEDFPLSSISQVWDIFLLVAIALARAEDQFKFEHRDLHEGNLCIRQVGEPRTKTDDSSVRFGFSGLDITILDYGLSRAENDESEGVQSVAFDLEKDLGIFTSTHAPQCKVYRQMRSFLLKGDRVHLPPESHCKPYDDGPDGPISWSEHHPYTNILWLAYIYSYLSRHFQGEKRALTHFKKVTKELWSHLDPDAPLDILSFSSATDVVRYAVEAGWLTEAQLAGDRDIGQFAEVPDESHNESIFEVQTADRSEADLRRSPRRRTRRVLY